MLWVMYNTCWECREGAMVKGCRGVGLQLDVNMARTALCMVGDVEPRTRVLWAPGVHTYSLTRAYVLHSGGLYKVRCAPRASLQTGVDILRAESADCLHSPFVMVHYRRTVL